MSGNEEASAAESPGKDETEKNLFWLDCARYVAFISNFLSFVSGATLVCFGAWFLFEPINQYVLAISATAVTQFYLKIMMYLGEACGACAIILATVGCCTAASYEKHLVRTFFVILVVHCLQLMAVISLDLYIRQEVEGGINARMAKSLMRGYLGDNARNLESVSWRKVQKEMKCCGYSAKKGYKDYTNKSQEYPQGSVWWQLQQGRELRYVEDPITKRQWPDSCCIKDLLTKHDEEECHDPDSRAKNVFRQGCSGQVKLYMRRILQWLAATAFFLGFIEVIHFVTIQRTVAIIDAQSTDCFKAVLPLPGGKDTDQATCLHELTGNTIAEDAKSK